MSGSFIARPLTDVCSQTFTNGNTKRNNEDLRRWIQTQELTRSQIVSITAGETSPEEGDSILTVYYRKRPIVKNESPLVNIDFATGEMQLPWDVLLDQAPQQAGNIIQFSRTPKNIGASNVQTIWYTNQTSAPCQFTLLTGTSFEQVAHQIGQLLNKSIAPHQLVSVTLFEESHPNVSREFNAVVCHQGRSEEPLNKILNKEESSRIFTVKCFREKGWMELDEEVLASINNLGGQEGHVVASANVTSDESNEVFSVLISWNALYEHQLEEQLRPSGCCTLF